MKLSSPGEDKCLEDAKEWVTRDDNFDKVYLSDEQIVKNEEEECENEN